jgi:DNA-binding transcriptional ArsR family regulator
MDSADKSPTIIIHEESDSLEELSEYLDVLSSSARLRILKFLEKKPRDARSISREIDKLLSIGVIKKEAGLGAPTSKGIHPVWEYSLVPGGLEAIIRNLGLFSNTKVQITGSEISRRLDDVKSTLNHEVLGDVPAVIILGGSDDGKVFLLKKDSVSIGRIDPASRTASRPGEDIVLSENYSAVTRVSRPHGRILRDNGGWYIEDCGSTGGTQLNNKQLEKNVRTLLHDGDLIEMAKGVSGGRFLVILPKDH